ncbi:Rpn family recombination-promoting nuclease/putative transposase [Haliea sp. E1-2-M8]|uniref:Rpn family recombination-promoting nuclease/putative transposase n=1 Tax=Haliea sp. E1-2-M8 TaxID=3064706 RepID=UPI00271C9F01|nr:Rpn family recombination-promoting nuclease/putative transposase [Haliea sp. E1-2-M8]MDO8861647.1 Rpn family recombination-promoting nuclease/putative transposase [Haliea sp. E1-2-M8]
MASQYHDTGYKELFSHPEFVQQLVEGFAPVKGLPPVLPMVLYNGSRRWTARQDIYDMIRPEPPGFLQAYQPHLRYYLVDEGRYTDQELATRHTPLSGFLG